MENLNLNAQIRKDDEKLNEVRNSKMIPAVVYGKKQEAIKIKVDYSEFLKLFRVSGESHIINLDVEGKKIEVLVHEIQYAPVNWSYLHVDFIAVTKWEKVHTKIHLEFKGVSNAVKEGGILEEHLKEVEVKVLPKNLVDSIEVDLSKLEEIGDSIKVSDLNVDSSKIEVLNNSDDVVAVVSKPRKAKEEEEEETTTEEVATEENK